MAFLEKFGVRDLGVLRVDLHREGRVVDGSFHAVEVPHQEYLERVWILLHKRAGETGPWPDHPKSLFEIVDNDRETFAAPDFALWRGYNQPVGIGQKKSRNRLRRPFVIEELDVLADFHAALLGAFPYGDFTKGADGSRRYRLAAQAFKCSQSLLTKQNQRAAVDRGSDVYQIRSRHVGMNRRCTTLVDVHGARQQCLGGCCCAQQGDVEVDPAL